MSATERYREARDQLVSPRGDHTGAVERFTWPDLGEVFNWGVDWFDAIARDNDRLALVVMEEDGSSRQVSFDAMAARSDRVAAWLASEGVAKGDPGLELRDGYGQTEMTAAVGNTPGSPVKPGSMGRPLPGVPVVLVDPPSNERVDGEGCQPAGRPRPGALVRQWCLGWSRPARTATPRTRRPPHS
jgi:acyl-coenzyme A synthetase/AMP-(fatty) acid ligase